MCRTYCMINLLQTLQRTLSICTHTHTHRCRAYCMINLLQTLQRTLSICHPPSSSSSSSSNYIYIHTYIYNVCVCVCVCVCVRVCHHHQPLLSIAGAAEMTRISLPVKRHTRHKISKVSAVVYSLQKNKITVEQTFEIFFSDEHHTRGSLHIHLEVYARRTGCQNSLLYTHTHTHTHTHTYRYISIQQVEEVDEVDSGKGS